MYNRCIKKLITFIIISILIISNSNNVIFANISQKQDSTNDNIIKINKNLQLYVSGSSMIIKGELINPITTGSVNEELKDIPKDSILKAIRYKKPNSNQIVIMDNIDCVEKINSLFKYPDDMKINILSIDQGNKKEITTDILNLRSQNWKMNLDACGTLTFITPDKKHFGILAHGYIENLKFKSLKVYTTKDVYIDKEGHSLMGFSEDKYIGYITHSTEEGCFGIVEEFDSIPIEGKYKIAPLEEVKKGEAYIISHNPKTQNPEKIKIDIIGNNGLPAISNRYSIVYKLNKESIGYVRKRVGPGYSGSPIVQNGRIIGGTSVKYNTEILNKYVAYPLQFLQKYIAGIDIYKYLYRLNNLREEHNVIDNYK